MKKIYKIILIITLVFFITNSCCLANTTNNKTPEMNNIKTAQINKNMTIDQKKKSLTKYLQDIGFGNIEAAAITEKINWKKVENDVSKQFYSIANIKISEQKDTIIHMVANYAHDEKISNIMCKLILTMQAKEYDGYEIASTIEYIEWNKIEENDLPTGFYEAININSNREENGWKNFHIHIPPYAHNKKEMQKYVNIVNILQRNKKVYSLWFINENFYKYSEFYDLVYENPRIKNKEKAFKNEVKKYNKQDDRKNIKEYLYYITMPVWIVPYIIFTSKSQHN